MGFSLTIFLDTARSLNSQLVALAIHVGKSFPVFLSDL